MSYKVSLNVEVDIWRNILVDIYYLKREENEAKNNEVKQED